MPDRPKRPLSGYMIWLGSAREQIKSDNPGIKVTEVAKKGGELWRAMEDKSEWVAKAAQAKEDYEDAVKDYQAKGGSTASVGSAKKRGKTTKKPAKKSKTVVESEEEDGGESD